mgnify:CR=1 FL=1
MKINLKELLAGPPARLRYVHRFSNCRVARTESVAEHSYYTTLYAIFLARWWTRNGHGQVDLARLLQKAILHDAEEGLTGDINRGFKYSSDTLRRAIERAGEAAFCKVFEPVVGQSSDLEHLRAYWATAKDGTTEGKILAFADFLSVLGYMWEEARAANRTLAEHASEMDKYIAIFGQEGWENFRPLVEQARIMLSQILAVEGFKA